jgi:hypothetical protein
LDKSKDMTINLICQQSVMDLIEMEVW